MAFADHHRPSSTKRILSGLGRGVATSGKLAEDGKTRALAALKRFRALSQQIGAKHIYALATAAAREASNGEQFISKAKKALGCNISVLTGKEEARYAALGVMAGIPDADGIAGDLGGGSLELIDIKEGKLRQGVTLPLGPLRLIDLSIGSSTGRVKSSTRHSPRPKCSSCSKGERSMRSVAPGETSPSCTWRRATTNFMYCTATGCRNRKPCPSRGSSRDFLHSSLKEIREVSRGRSDTMPFGALVLERLLAHSEPRNVEIFGLWRSRRTALCQAPRPQARERCAAGIVLGFRAPLRQVTRTRAGTVRLDRPALSGRESFLRRTTRGGFDMQPASSRTSAGAPSRLSRRALAFDDLAGGFVGVDHPGRVFLALTVFYHYDGEGEDGEQFNRLLDDEDHQRAIC